MMFHEEHDLASEYFSSMDLNLCFDPLVGTERVWYFVSFKRDDVNLNGDKERKKLINYLMNTILHLIIILNLLCLVKEVLLLLLINFRL